MANNVGNKLTIKCQDPDIMDRIKKLILRTNENKIHEFTMEILLPRSMAFADEEHYDPYWNNAVWDTKRDVYNYEIIDSGSTITIDYNTSWSPNQGWVKHLCYYIDHYLGYDGIKNVHNISVEHRYSDYPGDFGGILEWIPGTNVKYLEYDSYDEYLKNHNLEGYLRVMEFEKKLKSGDPGVMEIYIPT
jgi:hypothetical protein